MVIETKTERLSDKLREFLTTAEGRDVDLTYLRRELRIDPNSPADANLRKILSDQMVQERIVKPSGKRDGVYRVIKKIKPVKWWDGNINEEPIEFHFPRSYEDESEFGIEKLAEVFPGDMILIAGASNFGKTTLALSILGENLGLMPVLMGSEYTASDGKISPKFKRRMNRMHWVNWLDEGKPRFQLYPVGSDYEDYIQSDSLNVVDWISLPGEYWLIDQVMKSIKDRVGHGVAVVVLQKNRSSEFGEGGERSERYADIYMTVDPYGNTESMLTLGKVKAPLGKASGRRWAFEIVDYGANLLNIREIVKCPKCWGKGFIRVGQNSVRCDCCEGKKYIDK